MADNLEIMRKNSEVMVDGSEIMRKNSEVMVRFMKEFSRTERETGTGFQIRKLWHFHFY